MTQYLPPNLLALFAARDPIPYLPPAGKLSWEKKTDGYSGIAQFMNKFEDPKDTPPPLRVETRDERMERKRREKAEQMQYKLEQEIALWDPHNSPNSTVDPYKSLFIARINYDTSESKLRREFEIYGPIKKIVMVHNVKTAKPRGYAFIEYEHERDMHSAYKHADGKKIDGRRVLVDVERARTVKGWLSRRLGGGLGGTRRGGPDVNIKHSGREDDRKRGRDDETIRGAGERGERERGADTRGGVVERGGGDRDRDRDRERRRSRSRERGAGGGGTGGSGGGGGGGGGGGTGGSGGGGGDRDRVERDRSDRKRRSRSRDRKRRRSRSRERGAGEEEERRRHRSKSRDRKRRSRSRERKHRRDRDRNDRNRAPGEDNDEPVKIKQEPEDDYPDYSGSYYNNFPLKDEDGNPKNGPKYEDGEEPNTVTPIDY